MATKDLKLAHQETNVKHDLCVFFTGKIKEEMEKNIVNNSNIDDHEFLHIVFWLEQGVTSGQRPDYVGKLPTFTEEQVGSPFVTKWFDGSSKIDVATVIKVECVNTGTHYVLIGKAYRYTSLGQPIKMQTATIKTFPIDVSASADISTFWENMRNLVKEFHKELFTDIQS